MFESIKSKLYLIWTHLFTHSGKCNQKLVTQGNTSMQHLHMDVNCDTNTDFDVKGTNVVHSNENLNIVHILVQVMMQHGRMDSVFVSSGKVLSMGF